MSEAIDFLVQAISNLITMFNNMMFFQHDVVEGETVIISASLLQIIIYSMIFIILLNLFIKEVNGNGKSK